MWTPADVKAADADLGIADLAAAAAALNEQTVPGDPQEVSVASIHGLLMLAPTGDWIRITETAKAALTDGWPATSAPRDAVIVACRLAQNLAESKVNSIQTANWPAFLNVLDGLVSASVVAPSTRAAIAALALPAATVPKWQPPLTAGDVQTAREQP